MGVLRLALAISVLCTHLGLVEAHTNTIFGLTFLDGAIAVETFFMISGFYMALVLHEKYVGAKSYFVFLTQRLLRLCPTYLATLLLTVALLAVLMKVGPPGDLSRKSFFFWCDHINGMGFFSILWVTLSNLFVVGLNEISYFAFDVRTGSLVPWLPSNPVPPLTGDGFLLNPPAWSVSLEIYFYFMAPWLVRSPVWFQVALIAASTALRFYIADYLCWPFGLFVYRNFFCQFGFFVIGSLCYRFFIRYKTSLERWAKSWRHGFWILGAVLLFYRRLPWTHELYIVAIPVMIFLIPLLFAYTHNNAVDRLLGELSYPFYLSHFMALVLAYYLRNDLWMVLVGPFCLLVTLLLAWLLYRYVESWSERFRARLYHRQRPETRLSSEYFPQEAIEKARVVQG